MTLPGPFAYPAVPQPRRHGPAGYQNYQDFKPWLRDEFTFRCVYCLERETWYPNWAAAFSVDHIVPQVEDPARVCDYRNLAYACTRCNSARQDVRILDPTEVALSRHLRVAEDGSIQALSPEGQDPIDLRHLDRAPAPQVRRQYLRLLTLKARYPEDREVHQEFREAFGFPEDLPDLAQLKPPGGNSRGEGIQGCYFRLREQGRLPETY